MYFLSQGSSGSSGEGSFRFESDEAINPQNSRFEI